MTEPRDIADQDLLTSLIAHIEHRGTRDGAWKIARQALVRLRTKDGRPHCLSPRERAWANAELDRFEPRAIAPEAQVPPPRLPSPAPPAAPVPAVLRTLPVRPPWRP